MPVYEYCCPRGHVHDEVRAVEARGDAALCPCGLAAEKVILHPPRVFGDYEGYESPASGRWVEGRRARERDFAETGTRPYEDGEREQLSSRIAAADRELDRRVDAIVDQTLTEMTI